MKAVVSERGQVTIPKALRERLGISANQELDFEEQDGILMARKVVPDDPLQALVGLIKVDVNVDAYLAETRGPAWNPEIDGEA